MFELLKCLLCERNVNMIKFWQVVFIVISCVSIISGCTCEKNNQSYTENQNYTAYNESKGYVAYTNEQTYHLYNNTLYKINNLSQEKEKIDLDDVYSVQQYGSNIYCAQYTDNKNILCNMTDGTKRIIDETEKIKKIIVGDGLCCYLIDDNLYFYSFGNNDNVSKTKISEHVYDFAVVDHYVFYRERTGDVTDEGNGPFADISKLSLNSQIEVYDIKTHEYQFIAETGLQVEIYLTRLNNGIVFWQNGEIIYADLNKRQTLMKRKLIDFMMTDSQFIYFSDYESNSILRYNITTGSEEVVLNNIEEVDGVGENILYLHDGTQIKPRAVSEVARN